MLKKIFNPKRKRPEPGRHNTSKVTMDPVSIAILNRKFSPLFSRAKSPSDLLDVVGYPLIPNQFTRSSPELILYSTPLQLTDNSIEEEEQVLKRQQQFTIRNNTTPPIITSPRTNHNLLLLETSREDKTLVEEEKRKEQEESLLDETKREVYQLHQKLLDFDHEREIWKQRLQSYVEREEQMREIIHEQQEQIKLLKNMYYNSRTPSRHNSYRTVSTHSSSWDDEEDNEDEEDNDPYIYYPHNYYLPRQHNYSNLKRRYSSYYTSNNTNNYNQHYQSYYYYD